MVEETELLQGKPTNKANVTGSFLTFPELDLSSGEIQRAVNGNPLDLSASEANTYHTATPSRVLNHLQICVANNMDW